LKVLNECPIRFSLSSTFPTLKNIETINVEAYRTFVELHKS